MSKRGFTLIELLVVIAIIGILAAVVIAVLRGPQSKANYNAALASLTSAQRAAVVCREGGSKLTPGEGGTPRTGNPPYPMCAGSQSGWPELPSPWSYLGGNDIYYHPGRTEGGSDFLFKARRSSDQTEILCRELTCQLVGIGGGG